MTPAAMARLLDSPTAAHADDVREHIRDLADVAALGGRDARERARVLIRSAAQELGAIPASIGGLYAARGRGDVGGFTAPAVNVRGLTFETARALFRAMARTDCCAAIFELNRAEVGFTDQEPGEFAAGVLAAAIAEGYRGPVFLQGDHFQAYPKRYAADPEAEARDLEDLISRAVTAGFYCIDIDASTLVDLGFERVADQQATNVALTARLSRHVRAVQPPGVAVSIGGEIGEVGAQNSTAEELTAYVDGVAAALGGEHGLAKVSVQTGTQHGGLLLPDGTTASVALDFATLEELSRICRDTYGMAGAVQHGASTLPDELFGRFPAAGTAEVHLATGFQDIVMDHAALPAALREAIRHTVLTSFAGEREDGETEAKFVRRLRKKTWGPLKREFLALPDDVKGVVGSSLEERFAFLIERLGCSGTKPLVERYVEVVRVDP